MLSLVSWSWLNFCSQITYHGLWPTSLPVFVRSHLQMDGPYNEAFLEKLQKCPAEDDGSVEYAVAKVGTLTLSTEHSLHF